MAKEKLKISGKRVELPAAPAGWKLEPRPGGWVVATSPEGRRERLQLHEQRGRLGMSMGGVLYQGEVVAEGRGGGAQGGGGDADLVAQFPGKVRKLLVQPGAKVAEGDALVLVEAMKMEFSVKAPYSGVVKRVLVAEGQQLSPGDRFVELEASAKGDGNGNGGPA